MMGMIDLGHGVKVSAEDRTYFKVILEDSSRDKLGPDGKIRKTPVTIRADVKHSMHEWALTDQQKDIIKNEARTTLRKLTKKELLEKTAENGMSTPSLYEHISADDAKLLFQQNTTLRNEILRSPEFKEAVAEYVKTLASEGNGSLLDAIKDESFELADDDDEDIDVDEIFKEELDAELNDSKSPSGDAPAKVRAATVKRTGGKGQSKNNGTAKK